MLNGPALLRVFLVVVAAAVLTGLVQHYWIFDSGPPDASKSAARPTAQTPLVRRSEPASSPQVAQPGPAPAPAIAAQIPVAPPTQPVPDAKPQIQPGAQSPSLPTTAEPPNETRNAALTPSPPPAPTQPAPAQPRPIARPAAPPAPPAAEAEPAEEPASTDARAVDLVDLNTGSLAELNGLKGGGAIGRAIIQQRPYASTDQLLSKRVLSRAIYQRIKDQVTVR